MQWKGPCHGESLLGSQRQGGIRSRGKGPCHGESLLGVTAPGRDSRAVERALSW